MFHLSRSRNDILLPIIKQSDWDYSHWMTEGGLHDKPKSRVKLKETCLKHQGTALLYF